MQGNERERGRFGVLSVEILMASSQADWMRAVIALGVSMVKKSWTGTLFTANMRELK
jgi:hypothetical protein